MGTLLFFDQTRNRKVGQVVLTPAPPHSFPPELELEPVQERQQASINRLGNMIALMGGSFLGTEPLCKEDAAFLITQMSETLESLKISTAKAQTGQA